MDKEILPCSGERDLAPDALEQRDPGGGFEVSDSDNGFSPNNVVSVHG